MSLGESTQSAARGVSRHQGTPRAATLGPRWRPPLVAAGPRGRRMDPSLKLRHHACFCSWFAQYCKCLAPSPPPHLHLVLMFVPVACAPFRCHSDHHTLLEVKHPAAGCNQCACLIFRGPKLNGKQSQLHRHLGSFAILAVHHIDQRLPRRIRRVGDFAFVGNAGCATSSPTSATRHLI
ncbi:hypothetical protein BU26DRAFT_141888 [Trematosphaeria pertusa]|uniref:Uncharacterized protein n=1 Tax=Trematosphaeria pertusa TaxID=390896 RepID=A0A6A6IXF0_9PLEO|nr:uncharacterized protein BU26DRAFT_141888 [Trematosphaeria pertusa]KAF2254612.1 hypothetical protein BU26DRAFT_141888 [Trematosphaeria pertusa]